MSETQDTQTATTESATVEAVAGPGGGTQGGHGQDGRGQDGRGQVGATQTLSTATAAMALQNIPALIGLVAGNRLVTVNATIQAALTSAQGDATGEIVRLKAAFDAFEAGHPMVAAALDAARRSSLALGLDYPSEDQVVAQVKAAAVDLIGALLAHPAR